MKEKRVMSLIVKDKENNFIDIEYYYNLGGMNYFTNGVERRGFYISVSPIERNEGWTTYKGFSGGKLFIHEVGRFSKKGWNEGIDEAISKIDVVLATIDYVLRNGGLELEKDINVEELVNELEKTKQ